MHEIQGKCSLHLTRRMLLALYPALIGLSSTSNR